MMEMQAEYLKALGITPWRLREECDRDSEKSLNEGLDERLSKEKLPAQDVEQRSAQEITPQKPPIVYQLPSHSEGSIEERIRSCRGCHLYEQRLQPVIGRGELERASIIYITDTPLRQEEVLGAPIVEAAQKLFQNMLIAAQLHSIPYYITPFIKCRPQELQGLTESEVSQCYSYLKEELLTSSAEFILFLGREGLRYLLDEKQPLEQSRQKLYTLTVGERSYKVAATYAPAELLKFTHLKGAAWEDLKWIARQLRMEQ